MRTKELRKHIQRRIANLAERDSVPVLVRLHELGLITKTLSRAVSDIHDDLTPEPGDCPRCGRVLREHELAVCEACLDEHYEAEVRCGN